MNCRYGTLVFFCKDRCQLVLLPHATTVPIWWTSNVWYVMEICLHHCVKLENHYLLAHSHVFRVLINMRPFDRTLLRRKLHKKIYGQEALTKGLFYFLETSRWPGSTEDIQLYNDLETRPSVNMRPIKAEIFGKMAKKRQVENYGFEG